jgi:aldose 1-epimerase
MPQAATIAGITPFGKTADGSAVQRITLKSGELTVSLLTWGAVLQSVKLRGVTHDLTLGSETLADYEGPMLYHGSLIGPVVNRFSGASAPINGKMHRFEANLDNRLTLHSGSAGTQNKIWRLTDMSETAVSFRLDLPDGEGGFPGNRRITARYSLPRRATLQLEVTATTDAPTLINFANHSYWNLDGTPNWSGHRLTVHADAYLPCNADFSPTGEITPLADTAMDFRKSREINADQNAFDTNFCLAPGRRALTEALTLTGTSGVAMTVATTEPGIQVYDGRNAIRPGRAPYEGLAIEAQGWPDAPNHQGFPSIALNPQETYSQITEWRFHQPMMGP